MTLRTVTVKLEDGAFAEIEAESRARGVSRSIVVRERLQRKGSAPGSLWDRMRDLVVDADSAPPDLASNKARLRGYGRLRPR